MADIIDSASELEDLQRDAALSMRRINRNAVSATHCVDLRRVKVPGCQRCASCQQDEELRMKQGRM